MQVGLCSFGEVKIDDNIYSLDVNSPSEKVCKKIQDMIIMVLSRFLVYVCFVCCVFRVNSLQDKSTYGYK